MLHCGKDPFNRALRGSSISLKVMAAGPLGQGPAAEHHHLELFIMTRLPELSGAAAGSPAEPSDQRSADVASLVQTARPPRAHFLADHTPPPFAASRRWAGLHTQTGTHPWRVTVCKVV